jgi:2-keto-4-pentenoate hydratase
MVPVTPGDVFRAEFAHLGAVTVRFSNTVSSNEGE